MCFVRSLAKCVKGSCLPVFAVGAIVTLKWKYKIHEIFMKGNAFIIKMNSARQTVAHNFKIRIN